VGGGPRRRNIFQFILPSSLLNTLQRRLQVPGGAKFEKKINFWAVLDKIIQNKQEKKEKNIYFSVVA